MKYISTLCFLIVMLLVGCIQAPEYPIEPVIQYVGLTKNMMEQAKIKGDSLRVIFSFTDGDGDIGSINNGEFDIF